MHAPPGVVFTVIIKSLQTFQRETTNKTRCHYLQNKNLKQNRLYNRDEMNTSLVKIVYISQSFSMLTDSFKSYQLTVASLQE
jgi:hypothetical protein